MTADVEDKVLELMAKYQPVASDLRTIKSYMKIAYDLERFGRYAWGIPFNHDMFAKSEKCAYSEVEMKERTAKVLEMVHTSINAMKNLDVDLAKTLSKTENEVDSMYFKYLDRLANAPTTRNA